MSRLVDPADKHYEQPARARTFCGYEEIFAQHEPLFVNVEFRS
jgi:hypothetical protein